MPQCLFKLFFKKFSRAFGIDLLFSKRFDDELKASGDLSK
jgi:hypothetical protein